ncbi:MAG: fasciclin domain-containing protein [Candidatus Elarobacter sp.]
MKNLRPLVAGIAVSALLASAAPTLAQQAMGQMMSGNGNPMVGGHAMSSTKDIVSNAVTSDDNTILVAAVKAAGLVPTLAGKGPFTVFAPTDEAFKLLPAGTVDTLVKPENKATLTKILTYHVVAGRLDFSALQSAIAAGKGKAELKTVQGETLTAEMNGPRNIVLVDAKGAIAQISTYDVYQSNGVIHVIDKVLTP